VILEAGRPTDPGAQRLLHLGSIATSVNAAKPGGYTEVEIPKR